MALMVLQYVSLVTLTVQNALLALSMRYARTRPGQMFQSSTAVLNSEILKLITCLAVVYRENKGPAQFIENLKATIVDQPIDTLKVCIPSFVYVVQNNLLYVAASHLDAATYQVTYQLKILTTAIFSVIILRRELKPTQWLALFILLLGVVLVQLADQDEPKHTSNETTSTHETQEQNHFLGMAAAIGACCLSGFAGVYFEKILKGSTAVSLWMRNVQLSLCSIPFAFLTYIAGESRNTEHNSYFFGYDAFVVYLVVLQACGGLLVAVVVKYADNLLKGFATSMAIVLSCIVSIILFDFHLTLQFSFGTLLVLGSIFLYSYQPVKALPKSTMIAKV